MKDRDDITKSVFFISPKNLGFELEKNVAEGMHNIKLQFAAKINTN